MNEPPHAEYWHREPPASPEAIAALRAGCGLDLPPAYLTLLEWSNGGAGEIGIKPGWLLLWSAEEVMQANRDYEVQQWLPGFFGFGSNGGGELFAWDTRTPHPWKVYMIPFISLDEEDALLIADDFEAIGDVIGQRFDDPPVSDED